MNLLGITWGMGAQDVGMKGAVSGAQSDLEMLNRSLERQSKIASKSSVPGFFESLKQFNIGSMAQSMRDLTGDTGNLTNSLEAMATANVKAAKPFVASLNLTGKEARKMTGQISSMAIGLNVSAETVAGVFKTLKQTTGPAKEALDALGMSAKDFVKLEETTGIKTTQLTDVMGGLSMAWGVNAKDSAKFVNRVYELGKKADLGIEPMKGLKESLDAIGKPFEKLPPGMQRTGDEIMKLQESAIRMGGVFRRMGSSEEEASKLGQQTAQMFAEQAVTIEKAMKYGQGKLDDSPLFQYLTKLGVGMDDAVNVIETGSRDSVAGMSLLQGIFKKFGTGGAMSQAMLSELSGALGEGASGLGYLAANADEGAKALSYMSSVTITGKDTLKNYANQAFSSGRTLQESLDLMKQSFETRLRGIARKDVTRFVSDLGKAYKEVGDKTVELASDKNWGPIMKRLSAMQQLGVKGLFIKTDGTENKGLAKTTAIMDAVGGALSTVSQSMGPVISMFSELTILLAPLGKHLGKVFGKLGKMLKSPAGKLGVISMAIMGVIELMDWLAKSGKSLSGVIGNVLTTAFGWLTSAIQGLGDMINEIDWSGVGTKIGEFVVDVVTFIPKMIMNWAEGGGGGGVAAFGKAAWALVKALGLAIIGAVKGLYSAITAIGSTLADGFIDMWKEWDWKKIKDRFLGIGSSIKGWWSNLQNDSEFQRLELDAGTWFRDTKRVAMDKVREVGSFLWDGLKKTLKAMNSEDAGWELGDKIRQMWSYGLATVGGFVRDKAKAFADDAAKQLVNFDQKKVDDKWATIAAEAVIRFKEYLTGFANTMVGFMQGLMDPVLVAHSVARFFSDVWSAMRDGMFGLAAKAAELGQSLWGGAKSFAEQLLNPEKHAAKMKDLQARATEERIDQMKQDIIDQRQAVEKEIAYNKKVAEEWKKVQESTLSAAGIGIASEGKGKKQLAAEQKWLAGWDQTASGIAAAAGKAAKAEEALKAMRGKEGVSGADIAMAESAAEIAKKGLESAQAKAMAGANKGGIRDMTALAGIQEAIAQVAKMEQERIAGQARVDDARAKLAELQVQFKTFGEQASAELGMSFAGMEAGAADAGSAVIGGFVGAMTSQDSSNELIWGADSAAQLAADRMTTHSPIPDGPLAGVGAFNDQDPAYDAGYTLMQAFASGIDAGANIVTESVTNMLTDSVLGTIDKYQIEMQKVSAKKGLLTQVANMLMNEFGANVTSAVTDANGKPVEDVKKTMQAMLSVPGLAGVTMAVINEGAKTRSVLMKIEDNTKKIAESDLVKKGKSGGSDYVLGG